MCYLWLWLSYFDHTDSFPLLPFQVGSTGLTFAVEKGSGNGNDDGGSGGGREATQSWQGFVILNTERIKAKNNTSCSYY